MLPIEVVIFHQSIQQTSISLGTNHLFILSTFVTYLVTRSTNETRVISPHQHMYSDVCYPHLCLSRDSVILLKTKLAVKVHTIIGKQSSASPHTMHTYIHTYIHTLCEYIYAVYSYQVCSSSLLIILVLHHMTPEACVTGHSDLFVLYAGLSS